MGVFRKNFWINNGTSLFKVLSKSLLFLFLLVVKIASTKVIVMNSAFREAAAQVSQKPTALTHSQQVARLYRQSLRLLLSWCIDREIFNQEASSIRSQFDSNRNVSLAAAQRLLREGQESLVTYTHPDPYCVPHMPWVVYHEKKKIFFSLYFLWKQKKKRSDSNATLLNCLK